MSVGRLNIDLRPLRCVLQKREVAETPDADLLKRYVEQGDEAAFEVLVQRNGPMVLGVCRRILANPDDAADAFQATFLVLVSKAAKLQLHSTLGNWLYGVACRTAQHARHANIRRRAKEAAMPTPTETTDDAWADLLPILDQELDRLPEKYRAVILLCELQGKTRRDAAKLLRCAEGTVASRLSRGLALLAKRLGRHGSTVTAGALAIMLSKKAIASVPTSIVSATTKAASLFAAGQATAMISAPVASLTTGVIKAMFLNKLMKVTTVLLLAATALIGAGVFGHGTVKEKENQAKVAQPQEDLERRPSQAVDSYGAPLPAQDAHQAPARKEIGRILLSAKLRIMDGEEAKEKRPNGILLIDPESGEWKDLSIASARDPRLSPDGKTIAFGNSAGVFPDRPNAEQSIWTCDANGGNLKQIFDKGSKAFWSADGEHLIVTKETHDGENWKFKAWQIDPDGSNATQLPLPATDCAIDSSPDGKWITTISHRPQSFRVNGFQIYIMRPNATNERLLTHGGANIDPRFSPDGKKVLYTGYEQGNYKA